MLHLSIKPQHLYIHVCNSQKNNSAAQGKQPKDLWWMSILDNLHCKLYGSFFSYLMFMHPSLCPQKILADLPQWISLTKIYNLFVNLTTSSDVNFIVESLNKKLWNTPNITYSILTLLQGLSSYIHWSKNYIKIMFKTFYMLR